MFSCRQMVTDSECRQSLSDGQGYSLRASVLEGIGLSSHKWQNEDADEISCKSVHVFCSKMNRPL